MSYMGLLYLFLSAFISLHCFFPIESMFVENLRIKQINFGYLHEMEWCFQFYYFAFTKEAILNKAATMFASKI